MRLYDGPPKESRMDRKKVGSLSSLFATGEKLIV